MANYLEFLSSAVLVIVLTGVGSVVVLVTGRKPTSWVWGGTFGLCSAIALLAPIRYEGLVFDFRHIPIVIAAYVGGPFTALIAGGMGSLARLAMGGPMTLWGVASFVILGGVGLLLRLVPREQIEHPIFAAIFCALLPLPIYATSLLPLETWGFSAAAYIKGPIVFLSPLTIYVSLRLLFSVQPFVRYRAFLEALANSSITKLIALSPRGDVLFVSKALKMKMGIMQHVMNFIAKTPKILELTVEQDQSPSVVLKVPWQGDELVFDVNFSRVLLPYGEVGVVAILNEITELSTALQQLDQFFTLSVDALCIVGFDGYIQSMNDGLSSILGYTEQELYSLQLDDITHPEDLPVSSSAVAEMLASNQPIQALETRYLAKDGEYKWLSWSAVPMIGEQRCYIIARDVTGKRDQERALSHLAAIIDQAEHAIISMDLDYVVQTANTAAEKMFSPGNQELIGRSLLGVVTLTPSENLRHVIDHCERRGIPCTRDFTVSPVGGQAFYASMAFSPMRDITGATHGISLIAKDISKQKAWEQDMVRLDRLDLAGQLAAGIGHEIRNPMTTVKGFLQLFQQKPELQVYREHMQLLIGELDRANDIITEFLTLAKNRPIELSQKSLNGIIKSLAPLIESDALLTDKSVVFELGDIPYLEVNDREIRQLVLNLVRNGLDAMSECEGKVLTIETEVRDGKVCLFVKDEGTGIPLEVQGKIGTPFFTTKDAGTGLGLAVCYNIATKHGASMTFETGCAGTTFCVSFASDS